MYNIYRVRRGNARVHELTAFVVSATSSANALALASRNAGLEGPSAWADAEVEYFGRSREEETFPHIILRSHYV